MAVFSTHTSAPDLREPDPNNLSDQIVFIDHALEGLEHAYKNGQAPFVMYSKSKAMYEAIKGNLLALPTLSNTLQNTYAHRNELFFQLCDLDCDNVEITYSRFHADGTKVEDGWFIVRYKPYLGKGENKEISYHLPEEYWERFAEYSWRFKEVEQIEWDGHTSNEVLERMKEWSQWSAL